MRRMSPIVITSIVAWVLFMAWIAWGYFAVRGIQQPVYTVVELRDGYEIREYAPYLMAQVSLTGTWDSSLSEGFRILANYIFGDNISQESIAMTRPVGIEAEPEGEPIAMTAPVLSQEKNGAYLVSFIMPSSYTSATLPRPNDPQIRIIEVPAAVVAVRTFSGYLSRERALREEEALRELLALDKRVTVAPARVAQYNPPWTPPFLRRNEIQIPVRSR